MLKKIFSAPAFRSKTSNDTTKLPMPGKMPEYKASSMPSDVLTWTSPTYDGFSRECYMHNVIAYRCINLIASNASYIPFTLNEQMEDGSLMPIQKHRILDLLNKPNVMQSSLDLMQEIYSYQLISGNSYVRAVRKGTEVYSISSFRPDRVSVLTSSNADIAGYRYNGASGSKDFAMNQITGDCDVLHIKTFHPLSDYYGLSPIEAARFSIDQHNEASRYNKSLLQNCARPSGAMVVKANEFNNGGMLTDEQFDRLKEQLSEQYSGMHNSGKPLLLEGGLDWKEMSVSPKDMDFMESKNTAAREIALAFGVPPQLLGIKGDNTYNNVSDARIALWEQTIIPMMQDVVSGLNKWLTTMFNEPNLQLSFDSDVISSMSSKRETEWQRVANATFLTQNEKRQILGFPPLDTTSANEL